MYLFSETLCRSCKGSEKECPDFFLILPFHFLPLLCVNLVGNQFIRKPDDVVQSGQLLCCEAGEDWIWRLRITSTAWEAPIPKTVLRWSLLWWINTTVFEEIIISYLTRTFIHRCTSIILSFMAIPGKRSYIWSFKVSCINPNSFSYFKSLGDMERFVCVRGECEGEGIREKGRRKYCTLTTLN